MLTLLTSMLAGVAWLGTHLWVLLLAAAPAFLKVLEPLTTAITEGFSGFIAYIWQAVKTNNSAAWLLCLTVGLIGFGFGYHYGWASCIDYVHAHWRLSTKVLPSTWWKFW